MFSDFTLQLTSSFVEFWGSVKDSYPQFFEKNTKILLHFPPAYLCERDFLHLLQPVGSSWGP